MFRNQSNVGNTVPEQYQTRQAQTQYVQHDFDGSAKLTTTLVHAISDATGIDVTDTEFTLNDHVDPDALDALFRSGGDSAQLAGHLTFAIWDYQVTVNSDGQITIVPPARQPPARYPPAQRPPANR